MMPESIVMVREGWPAALCSQAYNHEHLWGPEVTGIACAYCSDELLWSDCFAWQQWQRYVDYQRTLVWRLS